MNKDNFREAHTDSYKGECDVDCNPTYFGEMGLEVAEHNPVEVAEHNPVEVHTLVAEHNPVEAAGGMDSGDMDSVKVELKIHLLNQDKHFQD